MYGKANDSHVNINSYVAIGNLLFQHFSFLATGYSIMRLIDNNYYSYFARRLTSKPRYSQC